MSFEDLLKKPTPKVPPSGIMVRPREDICKWLATVAQVHGVSVNKIVLTMIEAEFLKKEETLNDT